MDALYGIIFAPFVRRSGAHTLSEWLEMRFDSKTRTLITITTILGLLGIMANNVVSMAIVVTGFTGWSLVATLSVIFFMFLIFTYIGGFWAVTLTDFIQMCIGLIALPALIISIVIKYGGLDFASSKWPGDFGFSTHGISNGQMPLFSIEYPSILTFIILFACFLVWGNNYYWLRVSSVRSERTAKLSFIFGAVLLLIPIVVLAFVGVYAGAIFPDAFAPHGEASPMSAFGVVLKAVPISIAAFALIGALSASISTSTTALIGASSTAMRDLYQRFVKPNATPKELTFPSKMITLILGLLVWLLCFYPGGPLYLFAFSTAWLGPPSLLVLLGIWWKRTTTKGAFYGTVVGISVTVIFTLLGLFKIFIIDQYTHVGVVGLVATLVTIVVVSLLTKPSYYAEPGWKSDKVAMQKQSIEVSNIERKILKDIYLGYNTMAEISDLLGTDSSVSNTLIEDLDKKYLINREKYTGPGFYTFEITSKGMEYVDLNEQELQIAPDQVSVEDLKFLQLVQQGPHILQQYLIQHEYDSLKASAILSKLIKQNYLKEYGMWRRKVSITENGRIIVNKHQILLESVF